MAPDGGEKAFLRVAVAASPRIAEIICGFPPDDRAGVLEIAERRFMEGLPGRFRSTTQPDLFRTGGRFRAGTAQLVLSRERKGVERIDVNFRLERVARIARESADNVYKRQCGLDSLHIRVLRLVAESPGKPSVRSCGSPCLSARRFPGSSAILSARNSSSAQFRKKTPSNYCLPPPRNRRRRARSRSGPSR